MKPDNIHEKVNSLLTDAFNSILRIEELNVLGRPKDLTAKEIHVIETVGNAVRDGCPGRAAEIAAALRVAPSTLTASIDMLQKKGYLTRVRDEDDRRGVRVALTESGGHAKEQHEAFHRELTGEILSSVSAEEAMALTHTLEILRSFFARKESAMKKSAVKILADSTCDITPEEAKKLGVTLIAMSVTFDDTAYRQGIDMTTAEFYEKLATSASPPVTTQLTSYDLEKFYREATKDGSEAVSLHLSSAMSGTYQSAVLAAHEVEGVYPVDSKNATFGSNLLVREAVKMRDEGKCAAEIAEKITALSKRVRLFACVSTLKYLVRGGRLSAMAGVVGNVLNICPIAGVQDGAVRSCGKARGKAAAYRETARMVREAGIDKSYGIVFGHSLEDEGLSEFKDALSDLTSGCTSADSEIGAIIGTHVGPGAVGIAFVTGG